MKQVHPALLACVLTSAVSGAVKLVEDSPPCPPPQSGSVSGVVSPAGGVTKLRAVSRVTQRTYQPASFDLATGRLLFKNLPGDARYDICFTFTGGREIEGIDLDFVDQRLLHLGEQRRKQLALPPERTHQFSSPDVKELLEFVKNMQDFMDDRRVLYVQGHGVRATVLVELMRSREFYSAASGEVIWRMELWYFTNQFGGWEKLANQERVLRRVRAGGDQWRKISVEYYPQLSAYVPPEGQAKEIILQIPAKADPSRGRVAGTKVHIETPPYVLGLTREQPASAPATQAARDGGG